MGKRTGRDCDICRNRCDDDSTVLLITERKHGVVIEFIEYDFCPVCTEAHLKHILDMLKS